MTLKAAFTAAALLAGLALAPAQAATLRWAAQNDILTLDPHAQNHATTNAILMHSYEGLTRYSATYAVEPGLATKWTYITPTQVRFELRKGVKFHDGSPFTADDVVFTFGLVVLGVGGLVFLGPDFAHHPEVDDVAQQDGSRKTRPPTPRTTRPRKRTTPRATLTARARTRLPAGCPTSG